MRRSSLGLESNGKEVSGGGHEFEGCCGSHLKQTRWIGGPEERDTEESGGKDDAGEVISISHREKDHSPINLDSGQWLTKGKSSKNVTSGDVRYLFKVGKQQQYPS